MSLVLGELKTATELTFPTPTSTSWWQALLNQASNLINDFISLVTSAWNDLLKLVSEGIQWITGLWNNIVGTVMGPLIATVKNIVTIVLQQVVNTVIQPILNGQTTSLSTLFGGVSVDTIASYGPSAFANITSTINSESSLLASVGSTMGSMMSSISVFSGAGTILGPLISMAGPGIMVTVMSMIASVVMSTVLTPLFNEFSTAFSNDLNTLLTPLGGTSAGALAILDNMVSLTSVSSQPGVASQDSGSGYIAQSTGTSVGTTGTSTTPSSLGNSSTSCNITAIGTCMTGLFNELVTIGQTSLDNSSGFSVALNNVIAELVIAMETLTGSSSAPATSTTASTKAITTSATITPTGSVTAGVLGGLSIFKDLLGIIKTSLPSTDKQIKYDIQLLRIKVDILQLFLSIEYWYQDPSSVAPVLWLAKSGVSFFTNLVSAFDDANNVATQSYASISNTFHMSFDEFSQVVKSIFQVVGIVAFVLIYFMYKNSIKSNTKVFMLVYALQKLVKIILFGFKFFYGGASTPTTPNWVNYTELGLYAASIFFNFIQMIIG